MFENAESLIKFNIDLIRIDENEINIKLSWKEEVFANDIYFVPNSVDKRVVFKKVGSLDVDVKAEINWCTLWRTRTAWQIGLSFHRCLKRHLWWYWSVWRAVRCASLLSLESLFCCSRCPSSRPGRSRKIEIIGLRFGLEAIGFLLHSLLRFRNRSGKTYVCIYIFLEIITSLFTLPSLNIFYVIFARITFWLSLRINI